MMPRWGLALAQISDLVFDVCSDFTKNAGRIRNFATCPRILPMERFVDS